MATARALWHDADVVSRPVRRLGLLPVGMGAAALYGVLAAHSPPLAIGAAGALALVVLTFAFPVAHFTLLLAATAIVPYAVQNQIALGAGTGSPGLVLSDVLLLTGLLRATYVMVGW